MPEVGCRSAIRKKTYMPGSSEAEEGKGYEVVLEKETRFLWLAFPLCSHTFMLMYIYMYTKETCRTMISYVVFVVLQSQKELFILL